MIGKAFRRMELAPPRVLRAVLRNVVWEGTPESRCAALTFDDGPDPEITPRVLDTLDSIEAKGTFFLVGERVREHPGLAREIVERGHQIGSHSMTHQSLFLAGRDTVRDEIGQARQIIADVTGIDTPWFRPPHGIFDITAAREFKRQRCTTVLWSALSGDYRDDPPETILRQTAPYIRPGAIVVFHDTESGGGGALPGLIDSLARLAAERGVSFGRVDDLTFKPGIAEDWA